MPAPARQWSAAEDALLGTMPDIKLAKRLKIARKTVVERRAKLGVPDFRGGENSLAARASRALRELLAAIEAAGSRVPKSVRAAAESARGELSITTKGE